MKANIDIYSDYLLCSTSQASATNLSRLLNGDISHDSVTRFLNQGDLGSKELWLGVKPLVREHERMDGCLVFDDTVIEKEYSDENDVICWHYDHAKGSTVKGVNLLTGFYVTQKREDCESLRVPVMYEIVQKPEFMCEVLTKKVIRKSTRTKNEMMRDMIMTAIRNQLLFKYVLADSWFSSSENMTFIHNAGKYFIFDLKDNRLAILKTGSSGNPDNNSKEWTSISDLDIPENTPTAVWLKGISFALLLVKQVFKDENGNVTGYRFLVSNDTGLSYDDFTTIYKKRWGVEEYHKSLKQNASAAKSPTRTIRTQQNHLFCAIWAYIKLEQLKFQTALNHYQLKAKLYLKAIQAAFGELTNIKAKACSA